MSQTILFNDLILFRQRTGIAHYAAQLLTQFPDVAPDLRILRLSDTLIGKPMIPLMQKFAGGGGEAKPNSSGLLARFKPGAQDAVDTYLSALCATLRFSVLHEPDAFPFASRRQTVATVHDLSVVLFPQWHPEHRVKKYEKNLEHALRRTDHFIAVSQSTKEDMVRLLSVDSRKIDVIAEAPRAGFGVLPKETVTVRLAQMGISGSYFLHIGTLEPRKNIEGLLHAYAQLSPTLRERFPLLLAGGWGWRTENLRELLQKSPWNESVRHLGYVPDDDLAILANGARAVVYPSFYEGFGLPPLEAMACGTAAITSHAGGLKEAVGDAAEIIQPGDPKAIAEAMRRLAEDPARVAELVRLGHQRLEKFSWKKAATETAAVYRRLAGGK